jgi:hypothetical protein
MAQGQFAPLRKSSTIRVSLTADHGIGQQDTVPMR